jgi:cyclophilin family peptidyl-prolyl cis-trans isomerase
MSGYALLSVVVAVVSAGSFAQVSRPAMPQPSIPVIVVDTSRGSFSIETFPEEAPTTVAHIVALVRSGFYDGQRVHRAVPGFLVQFGDPQSRDPGKRDVWGRGAAASSGHPIGAAEISMKHLHVRGAVGMAHMGDPTKADSQLYLMLDDHHELDGRYVVFGRIASGDDVPGKLQVGDEIIRASVFQR